MDSHEENSKLLGLVSATLPLTYIFTSKLSYQFSKIAYPLLNVKAIGE